MKYGISYKGSKNKLADQILNLFPKRKNLYDVFCGGGAITHAALLKNNFERVFMNDINPLCTTLFLDAAQGKYHDCKRWVSRNDFIKTKGIDPYNTICWSFGNNLRDYLYAQDLEELKHAWHNVIFYNDVNYAREIMGVDFTSIQNIKDRNKKYSASKLCIKNQRNKWTPIMFNQTDGQLQQLQNLNRLQSLQSLESLERLERLERLEIMTTSFENVYPTKDSIIYCDIPYENTNAYGAKKDNLGFNFECFYNWAENQKELCFISSYDLPRERFEIVAEFTHRSTLAATANNEVTERVFIPKHQIELYRREQPQPSLFSELW